MILLVVRRRRVVLLPVVVLVDEIGDVDVVFTEIVPTVKIGDTLTISHDKAIGQDQGLSQRGQLPFFMPAECRGARRRARCAAGRHV